MNTTTIYRIKEKNRTTEIAQSVKDTDFRAAVLNTVDRRLWLPSDGFSLLHAFGYILIDRMIVEKIQFP